MLPFIQHKMRWCSGFGWCRDNFLLLPNFWGQTCCSALYFLCTSPMRIFWGSMQQCSVLGKDITVMTGDGSRWKSVSEALLPADSSKMTFVYSYLPLVCLSMFFTVFLVSLFFIFFTRDAHPKCCSCFIIMFVLCYLVHLPASYLTRRYTSLVCHSLASSVVCFPAPARYFFQEFSFVAMFPDRRNSLLRILGLNWSSCKLWI